MTQSRTKNSVRNASIAVIIQIINAVTGIINRTLFIKLLGNDYLSVNGLFTNILTLLSFAELGIGNAIIFALYKPLAENNHEKIREIVNLYRKAFNIIALVIIAGGLCFVPFLQFLVTDVPDVNENITVIFLIFVLSTSVSYVFSYKNSIIIADQKNYVVLIIKELFTILRITAQLTFLYLTHNYIGYLMIEIVSSLTTNLVCYFYANRKYPYLRNIRKSLIPLDEKKKIFKDVKSLFIYKGGSAILNGTDNIIISIIVATSFVGICSNYVLVINTINAILMQGCNSIVASIGNHNALVDNREKEKKFREINSICFLIFSFASICLCVLLNPLIVTWLGSDFVLNQATVIALVCPFLLTGLNQIVSSYRMTMGLFKQSQFIPLIAAFLNIVLSILLGMWLGLIGIFIATSISKLLTFSIFDPYLIYKNGFKQSSKKYFLTYLTRLIITICIFLLSFFVVKQIRLVGWGGLFVKTAICVFLTLITILPFLLFSKDFKDSIAALTNVFKKRKNV